MSKKNIKKQIWVAAYLRALPLHEPSVAEKSAKKALDLYEKQFPKKPNHDPFDPRCWSAEERASFEEAMREDEDED